MQGEIPGCTPENVQLGQDENNNPTRQPSSEGDLQPSSKFISEVKQDVKSIVLVEENQTILEPVQKLVKQGNFLALSKCE